MFSIANAVQVLGNALSNFGKENKMKKIALAVLAALFTSTGCEVVNLGSPGMAPTEKHFVQYDGGDLDAGFIVGDDVGPIDMGFIDAGYDVGFRDANLDAEAMDAIADADVTDVYDDVGFADAEADSGLDDSGVHPDADLPDAIVDSGPEDTGVHPDAFVPDMGFPDAEPIDAVIHPDAEITDNGIHFDATVYPDATPDTGFPDSGFADSGTLDSGLDAGVIDGGGPPVCPAGFIYVAPGSFTMGTPAAAPWFSSPEGPQHQVSLTYGYIMGETEVTRAQLQAVLGIARDPSWNTGCGANCPATNVSWDLAAEYANALSISQGLSPCYAGSAGSYTFVGLSCTGWRMPTEAEWEFAARAGSTTAFWNGDPVNFSSGSAMTTFGEPGHAIAWWLANSQVAYTPAVDTFTAPDNGFTMAGTHPVATKTPNPLGLYDMNGNVWELTSDCWTQTYPGSNPRTNPVTGAGTRCASIVRRGGSFADPQSSLHNSTRFGDFPHVQNPLNGFRIARNHPACQ